MQTKIKGVNSSGQEVDLKALDGGIIVVANRKLLWTAKGYGWQAITTAAVAAVVVRPSTVSLATLYNNTPDYFVIERAFAHELISAAVTTAGIWLCVHPVGGAVPAGNNIAIRNNMGGLVAGTIGIMDTDEGVVDNGWFPWGVSGYTLTITTPSHQLMAEIDGRIVLPPTAAISIQVVASVNTATFTTGFHWFKVPKTELIT
jgi:hypothetical protein